MPTYEGIGATYGTNTNRTYGTLFDPPETAPTLGLVQLFARVTTQDIYVVPDTRSVQARVTTQSVGWTFT